MVFSWDWKNTCVVFDWWQVRSWTSFVVTFLAIMVLAAGYELYKSRFQRWESAQGAAIGDNSWSAHSRRLRVKRALFYSVQVGYSFMLMLVFMTYTGWFMLALVLGAALGNFLWGSTDSRGSSLLSLACH